MQIRFRATVRKKKDKKKSEYKPRERKAKKSAGGKKMESGYMVICNNRTSSILMDEVRKMIFSIKDTCMRCIGEVVVLVLRSEEKAQDLPDEKLGEVEAGAEDLKFVEETDNREMVNQTVEQSTEEEVKQTEEMESDEERKIPEDQGEDSADPEKRNESVIQKKSDSGFTRLSRKDISEIHASAKKNLALDVGECMKAMRDIQKQIRETYEFEPCRRLCELARNIQQGAYINMDDVSEDLGYIMEMFGIISFDACQGENFDAKKHEQVKTHFADARERKIEKQYSPGYEKDGEIIMKAQVSVQ